MKRILIAAFAGAFLLACNNEKKDDTKTSDASITNMDDKDKTKVDPCAGYVADTAKTEPPMDSTSMAAWMAASTPGEMHSMLAKSNGDWVGDVTHWMDPAAPPQKSKSYSSNKMILGGRFQMSEHSGCFGGMPFEGIGIVGYDNMKKVFTSSWIDNMGTMTMNMEGMWDDSTRTMRLAGRCTNPMNGQQMNVREEYIIVDDSTHKMVMYGPDMKGKEFKKMEIVFTRKK